MESPNVFGFFLLQKLLGPFDFGSDSERIEEPKKEPSSSQL